MTTAIWRLSTSVEGNCACVDTTFTKIYIWEAAVGETLSCVREPRNARDRYAVAVEKDGRHGHWTLAQEGLACLRSIAEARREYLVCVTGKQRYSADLPQGGVEIPCFVLF